MVIAPGFDFKTVSFLLRERGHKAFRELAICNQRNIHVDGFATYCEAVGILAFVGAGRDVDDEIRDAFFDERENAWFTLRTDLIDFLASNIIFGKKIGGVFSRKKLELHIREHSHRWQ